jgi:DNA-binding MarR family transcriptional regulator
MPLSTGSAHDGAAPALIDALRAITRELRLVERDAEHRLGLPPAQAHVLRHLGRRAASSLAELADRTHTDPSSASVVVQRLVERGLVVRTPAADDRRRTELTLTPSGRALLRRRPASASDRLETAVASLGDQRTTSLARGLSALARALNGAT